MGNVGQEDVILPAADAPKIHFVVVPLMAQGHLIPLVDFARLLAQRGALVSLATTPLNASRVHTAMDRAATHSNLPLRLVKLELPYESLGLPQGIDSFDALPCVGMSMKLIEALPLLADPLKDYIRNATPRLPTCLVSDFCQHWTRNVAAELGLPRYLFFSICCFTLHCTHVVSGLYGRHGGGAAASWTADEASSEFEVVPGIPHHVEVTKAQVPPFFFKMESVQKELAKSEDAADGIIINTFEEMEPEYIEMFEKDTGKKVWPIGPVSLCGGDKEEKAARGDKPTTDETEILAWMDSQDPKSVIYVSFGSLVRPHPVQIKELGAALEASEKPFIWVIRPREQQKDEIDVWLAEGFSEKTKGRGLIIRGWAPQVLILSHPSLGAYVTHCGWNSSMEAITAGVPTITWPCFADQYLNERFHVDVLRTGVSVGVKDPMAWFLNEENVAAKREQIEEAVRKVMDEDEEAVERRHRAATIAEKAKMAMDVGGSSYKNLTVLIDEALQLARKTWSS